MGALGLLRRARGAAARPSKAFVGVLAVLAVAAPIATVAATTPAGAAPPALLLTLAKSASVTSYSAAGTVITYSYTVTNAGSSTLANVTVTDPMPGLSSINCGGNSNVIASLAAGASVVCTATYTTTQGDLDAGSITNTAEASGGGPAGGTKTEDTLTIPAVQVPQLQIQKAASIQGFAQPGTSVTYTFTVTNTGNVTLTNVTVTDPMPGLSAINCGGNSPVIPSLAPGASVTCTATYVVTIANVKNQSITNTAAATGTAPDDQSVSSNSELVIPEVGQPFSCANPGAFLSQSNSPTGLPPTVPIQLYYSQSFFNAYNWPTLGSPHVPSYNALGYDTVNNYLYAMLTFPTSAQLIRIDASGTYTVVGPVTPQSGSFNWTVNGPDVGAFDGSGDYWFTQSKSTTAWELPAADFAFNLPLKAIPFTMKAPFGAADWTFTKGAGGAQYLWGLGGGLITRVTLPGATPLAVTTTPAPAPIPAGTGAGAAWTYGNGDLGFSSNATGDVYEVGITNPATPTFVGYPAYLGPKAGTINDGAACPGAPVDLGIQKRGPATVSPGGTVTWTLTVTNYGPGNSSGFSVTDPVPPGITGAMTTTPGCSVSGGVLTCAEGILDVGNSYTIILTGTASGKVGTCVTNTASVHGNELDPNPKNNTSSVTTCVTPDLSLTKAASVTSYSSAGTVITYSYTVVNNGPSTLLNVTVTDPMPGLSAINCGGNSNVIAVLPPATPVTCTATRTVTTADLNAGSLTNTGTATAVTPSGPESVTSTVTVPAVQDPGVSIQKSADVDEYTMVGQVIPYSFVVTNTGNVTLSNVTVTDPLPGLSAINCGSNSPVIPSLAPGASVTCTATYVVTAGDLKLKDLVNTATVKGTSPQGVVVTSASTHTIPDGSEKFDCSLTNSTDFLSQSTSSAGPPTAPTQLYGTTSNIWTYATIGATYVPTYNALGYDTKDHFLYATTVHPSGQDFLTIAASGTVIKHETIVAPYTSPGSGPDVGGFDNSGDYFFTTSGSTLAWEITAAQIAAGGPTIAPTPIKETKPYFQPADWAFVGGDFWGAAGTMLYEMTPSGTVSAHAAPAQLAAVGSVHSVFGAAWTFGNGDLGVSNNATGKIFMIKIAAGPTFSWVTTFQGPTTSSVNDGASCIGEDVDLGIVKTAPALVTAGGTITWTLTVTDHGPGNSSGFVVNDAVPAGVTNVASTTPGCTATGNAVQCQGNVLNVGHSVTITITGTAPAKPGVCVTNTAAVIGADHDPNPSNNSSSARTCTTTWIHITKTTDVTNFATAGTVVPFSFVVTNVAPVSKSHAVAAAETLHDVTVTDALVGLSQVECGASGDAVAALAPGAHVRCTATYVATPADVRAGAISNVATASAVDGTGQAEHATSDLVKVPRGLHVTSSVLKGCTVGAHYGQKLTAAGGPGPYRWTLVEGALPAGLKLSGSGAVTGTPKSSGLYVVTVEVTSARSTASLPAESATATLSITAVPKK